MKEKNVVIKVDKDTEMLQINIDGTCFFEGNFWDFNRPDDIIRLAKKLTNKVTMEEYSYE